MRAFALLLFLCLPAIAQILPIGGYTIADGLAHNNITKIYQDAKGYLWIATGEGLSRFDGYGFKNYGREDGLASAYINEVTADRNGRLWVAINDVGVARFLDDPAERVVNGKKFIVYKISLGEDNHPNNVSRILFDADNRMWCATEGGIFRARTTEITNGDFEMVETGLPPTVSREAYIDWHGAFWFGLRNSVVRISGEKIDRFELAPRVETYVRGLVETRDGQLFAATEQGIYQFDETQWQKLDIALKPNQPIRTLAAAADDGGLWIGTNAGLIHFSDSRQTIYTTENGLTSDNINAIFSDRDNNLWLGTIGGGINYRPNSAIVNYPVRPGSLITNSVRFLADQEGNIIVQNGCTPEATQFLEINDDGIISPLPFPSFKNTDCRKNLIFQTADGRWWFDFGDGLKTARVDFSNASAAKFPDGQLIKDYVQIYADQQGKIWLSAQDRTLYVADASDATPRFEIAARDVRASLMLRDKRGQLWLGSNSYLGCLRNGQLEEIKDIGIVGLIQPRSIFEDSNGRLWIGTRFDGAIYSEEPDAPTTPSAEAVATPPQAGGEPDIPQFKKLTTTDSLSSSAVWAIAEDDIGGIYFGTGRGVDRYEKTTGRIRHFAAADGLGESGINHMLKDDKGRIWIASNSGVSRIDPAALDRDSSPPAVFINRINIDGSDIPLPDTGVANFTQAVDLAADQNNVAIQFGGIALEGEHSLLYQYKLEGYDNDWSEPGVQREVALANLGSGSYQFLVRAVDQNGVQGENTAVLQFKILPPIWLRWWFITLAVLAAAGVLYALYRYRLSRVVELERVRTRIATDLHDDIGSNLTRIALMSEVLNQQGANGASREMLPSIANIARESVASMNDIVWAISPEHDRVLDLTRRMRQHAEEVFTIRDIDLAFVADSQDSELKLNVGLRRDVLLIFKEAVNNAAKHSDCTRVEIDFLCSTSKLRLRIADNGRGFVEDPARDGHGLTSMSRRAESLGGKLDISSEPNKGTTVDFELPL